jgi:hypothetical protein
VTCCQEAHPTTSKVINDCGSERRTFRGISARSCFIKKNQIAGLCRSMDPQDRGQVSREGGEALRDRLVVTDIRPKTTCRRYPRAGIGGNREASMVCRDQETNGLEGDRLTTRVWASDEEYALAVTKFKVNGDHSTE